ncbi:agmatine deiminase family protein [Jiulongibacter sediminis]|uniref:Agmatine deiminase n=1 Tax=Jiulongibacter sediminis TaxID=1605367 RepID=A0A0P7BRH0_9BACT|nr:agmatine deiminase family protein [Jiulongibacter sediminis]KPM49888.1 agmatine deiminase [Jiulongibacter sediminis]TBX26925.1 agmatine deiminase [Jiulongibacter sediminis]
MTPNEEGYFFPAEWHPHRATWLSFPHNIDTWEDRLPRVYEAYFKFIAELASEETVCISSGNDKTKSVIELGLNQRGIPTQNIQLFDFKTNDSWCRDHGPSFVINPSLGEKAIVNWGYNAWGGKYPPFDADDAIPSNVAKTLNLKLYEPGIIMEGGSIEVNGDGTLMTSKSCLLNKNRNPHLSQKQIEEKLKLYYNVEQILWLEEGIVGDDTDGHVDDMTRFINSDTVLTALETDRLDDNYSPLRENLELLKKIKLAGGTKINIETLPMPDPVLDSGLRLPASYANFYILNNKVIVPTYRCKKDDEALKIIEGCFPDRKIVGIDSTDIIWGLGSFHCLSQQEPEV